jgi:hypothetical protein
VQLPLPAIAEPSNHAKIETVAATPCEADMQEQILSSKDPIAPAAPISSAASSDPAWTLAHRYLSLSYVKRIAVAQALKLIMDSDETLPHSDLFRMVFRRAKQSNVLAELWDEVELQGAWTPEPNPFNK